MKSPSQAVMSPMRPSIELEKMDENLFSEAEANLALINARVRRVPPAFDRMYNRFVDLRAIHETNKVLTDEQKAELNKLTLRIKSIAIRVSARAPATHSMQSQIVSKTSTGNVNVGISEMNRPKATAELQKTTPEKTPNDGQ